MRIKLSAQRRTELRQIVKFFSLSLLAGAVLAGIALPTVGVMGLAAKGTAKKFDSLSADLKIPPLSQRTTILDSKNNQIATVYWRDRTVVRLEDISPHMKKAITAIEDRRFYQHGAIDLEGVLRALYRNARSNGVVQGASTLTQQYVKNVFIEEAGDDQAKVAQATQQTLGRKIRELRFAIQVEKKLSKDQILENYLNITFFGQQTYGVEAAARRYFTKSAKNLTLEEAALLAGIVQWPSRYNPVTSPDDAKRRRDVVLQRMADVRDISQEQADRAMATPIRLKVSPPNSGCIAAAAGTEFFCDYVRAAFLNSPAFGKTRQERTKTWNRGGLSIHTTLDPQAQESVQQAIKDHVDQGDRVATAVTLVEPGTGKVLGLGQSRPYGFKKGQTQINYSVEHEYGGSNFGFPTGSTFKPFVAAAALERGVPATQSYSSPYSMQYPSPVQTCGKPWRNTDDRVENEAESEIGPYTMKEAMAKSVNTYFVQMISDIGLCPVKKMLDKLRVKQGNGAELPQVPAIALGSRGVAPITLASAYAAFAHRGVYCTPITIASVTTLTGKALPAPKSSCTRVMSKKTADTINTLLRGVIDSGTGAPAGLAYRDSAGKTGTTDGRKNAWFVGYTPNISGAVWVGSDTQQVSMENITIGGRYWNKVYGGQVPGPIWRDAVTGALDGKPAPYFNSVYIPEPERRDTLDSSGHREREWVDADNELPPEDPCATPLGCTPSSPPPTPDPRPAPCPASPGPPDLCCDGPTSPASPDGLSPAPCTSTAPSETATGVPKPSFSFE